MFKNILLIALSYISHRVCEASEQCTYPLTLTVSECLSTTHTTVAPTCVHASDIHETCKQTFNYAKIRKTPYDDKLFPYLFDLVFKACCGLCTQVNTLHDFHNTSDFAKAFETDSLTNVHFAFPLLHEASATNLYSKSYLPLVILDKATLITVKRSSGTIINTLLMSVLNLWPLLFVTIMLAMVAGFFGWIMDTWQNEEEFPRPFLRGIFEGFWWAFVSMTTVGYGDKSPKSASTRIFSVMWILIGITICSMLTAALSSAIATASLPPEPTISGKTFGVLNDRFYDLNFVIKGGGTPVGFNSVRELKQKLEDKEIDGFVLDQYASIAYQNDLKEFRKTEKTYDGDKMAYGALVLNESVYNYFIPMLTDNGFLFETCTLGIIQNKQSDEEETTDVFAPSGGLFMPTCVALLCTMVVIAVFGFFYEQKRKHNKKVSSDSKDIELTNEINIINDIENIVNKWKDNNNNEINNNKDNKEMNGISNDGFEDGKLQDSGVV